MLTREARQLGGRGDNQRSPRRPVLEVRRLAVSQVLAQHVGRWPSARSSAKVSHNQISVCQSVIHAARCVAVEVVVASGRIDDMSRASATSWAQVAEMSPVDSAAIRATPRVMR
jgi:hypothetical protein